MNLHYIKYDCKNPYKNLALEECILNNATNEEVFLYLWQNSNTVVIGKNQNPWRECNLSNLERDNCRLARRITGGGAVYHDLGNLNFSFIVPKKLYDLKKQFNIIIETLDSFSIKAQFSGRNDLLVEGSKFSGNAFAHKGNYVLHHGTLLLNSDFSKFPLYLNVSSKKMQSKGVASVQSRVTNLSQYGNVTVESIKEPLILSFADIYNGSLTEYPFEKILDSPEFKNLVARNESKEWLFHSSPMFNMTIEERFSWGEVQLYINVKKGAISEITCYSDSLDENISFMVEHTLAGIPYDKGELEKLITQSNPQLTDIIKIITNNI